MIGFGLDLSGYTTQRTSLAAAVVRGQAVEAVLLKNSALSIRRATDMSVEEVVGADVCELTRCLDIGPVAVYIPIDLQHLLAPQRAEKIWELTRRPIDKRLNGMAPLADRIGAPVARFAAILRKGGFESRLGKDLFETYPSENLRRIYGQNLTRPAARERFCRNFSLDVPNDDDLDAVVCAIAAVVPDDAVVTAAEFDLGGYCLPNGFRILKRAPFERITVTECDFAIWMTDQRCPTPSASSA